MAEESVSPAGSTSPELSPEEEWQKIRESYEAARAATKAGDTFCLISSRWWEKWREFTSNKKTNTNEGSSPDHQDLNSTSTPIRPSSIDNSDLINESASVNSTTGIELRDYLQEGAQYILLPEATWNALHSWYRGGPRLSREVISCGEALYVEVYPLRLYLHLMPKADKCTIRISKKEKIGALQKKACEIFQLNSEKVSVWDYFSHRKHALMNDLDKTLNDANIQTDQDILVEVNDDGDNTSDAQENGFTKNHTSALLEPSGSKVQSAPSGVKEAEDHKTPVSVGVSTRGSSVGLTGLLNFGNTCFMNSAIQCLVHTPEFAKYFREDYYKEINRNNPLGMVGELAVAFGDLLRKLWAPGRTPFAPKQFKAKLARFAPQFSGYSQHDSQELLAFLLDGLHEDLNRVKHKPYIKSRDADGRPDEEVADEYWANHIARNNSIIVDVCQGQYKSTLVCPVCEKISVTFDPFMYLSLPFQSTTTRTMTVTVFSCDGSSVPVTCTVNVPKQGCCRDLVKAVASACGLKQNEKVFLAEIQDHLIHRFLEDPLMSLSSIKDDYHLSAYKIPKSMKNTKFLQLIHRRQELEPDNAQGTTGWKAYGTPLVFPVSSDATITRGDLQLIVHTMLSPMLKTDTSSVASGLMNESFEPGSASKESNGPNCPQLKLPLKMVDGNHACIDLSVGEERTVRLPAASLSVLLFIDWSPKLLQKYETHYLERLPEVFKHGSSKKARTEPLSLYTCLEGFLREEPLVPEDMWFCPQCKERRQASKKLDLWRLPEVLVIHLKRFSYSRSMNKLETFVNFPIHDFDLTNYIANKNNSGPQAYDLYALINHYGGMGSGHYTAHIKLIEENRWYSFDDNHITLISEDEVKSNAAYVLFYRRKRSD